MSNHYAIAARAIENLALLAKRRQPIRMATDGPREGDVNAEGLRFHNHRWRRDDDTSSTGPESAQQGEKADVDSRQITNIRGGKGRFSGVKTIGDMRAKLHKGESLHVAKYGGGTQVEVRKSQQGGLYGGGARRGIVATAEFAEPETESTPVAKWASKRFKDPAHAKAFVKWFGDSKVVDDKGEPLVVYHGSDAAFDEFIMDRLGDVTSGNPESKLAFSFAGKADVAAWYGTQAARIHHNRPRPQNEKHYPGEEPKSGYGGENITPVFLSFKNPFIASWSGKNKISVTEAFDKAIAGGHDSLIVRKIGASRGQFGPKKTDYYFAFHPKQIKSATGNRGTFDPDNPKITMATWTKYEGPRGGNGWRNTATGDVLYQDEMPGDGDTSKEQAAKPKKQTGGDGASLQPTREKPATIALHGTDNLQVAFDNGSWFFRRPGKGIESRFSDKSAGWVFAGGATRELILNTLAASQPKLEKQPVKQRTGPAIVHIDDISVDAPRFQYKIEGIGAGGVTQQFSDVDFNPELAGMLYVWHDPESDKTFVVNGHHRYQLAKRSGWKGELPVRFIDRKTATEARAFGALINIAEGAGTALDAAKFMRDTGMTGIEGLAYFKENHVSVKGQVAADSLKLANLSDKVFSELTYGRIPIGFAKAIGEELAPGAGSSQATKDAVFEAQNKLLGRIHKSKSRLSESVVREMALNASLAPKVAKGGGPQKSLFGDDEEEEILFEDRGRIQAAVRDSLTKDVRGFGAVSSAGREDLLRSAGVGDVSSEAASAKKSESETIRDMFDREIRFRGETGDRINSILNNAAKELHDAKTKQDRNRAAKTALDRIRRLLTEAAQAEQTTVEPVGEGSESNRATGSWIAAGLRTGTRRRITPLIAMSKWVRYQGPRGGKGWKSGATGEILYQDEMPGGKPGQGEQQDKVQTKSGQSQDGNQSQQGGEIEKAAADKKRAKARALRATQHIPDNELISALSKKDDPSLYFKIEEGTRLLPVAKLKNIRARPEGIANAARFMYAAALGKMPKRGPVSVMKTADGGYEIYDGNSTFNIAKQAGWKNLPVQFVDKDGTPIESRLEVARSKNPKRSKSRKVNRGIPKEARPKVNDNGEVFGYHPVTHWPNGEPLAYGDAPDWLLEQPITTTEKERYGSKIKAIEARKKKGRPPILSPDGIAMSTNTKKPGPRPNDLTRAASALEKLAKLQLSRYPIKMEAGRAPAGGVNINGEFYVGGQFIPGTTQEEVDNVVKKQLGDDGGTGDRGGVRSGEHPGDEASRKPQSRDQGGIGGGSGKLPSSSSERRVESGVRSGGESGRSAGDGDGTGDGSTVQRGSGLTKPTKAAPATIKLRGTDTLEVAYDSRTDSWFFHRPKQGIAAKFSPKDKSWVYAGGATRQMIVDQLVADQEAAHPKQPAVQDAVSKRPTRQTPTDCSAGNYRYQTRDFAKGGLKQKFNQNIAALKTLQTMRVEGRTKATAEEQETMAKFVGWGAYPALFNEDYTPHVYGRGDELEERKRERAEHLERERVQKELDPEFNNDKWKKEKEILKSVLSAEEFKSAKGSILNAHFTAPSVVDAHWKMAQKLGFNGGRFLETSAGIGYYLGMMPPELAKKTHTSAVELDQSTGNMLKAMYPSTNVQVTGFQNLAAPDNFYDLVASNVPFGNYGVHDKRYNQHDALIHDYFFLKSVDLAAPGGLVMHITSTGTMDKPDSKIRKELMKTCDIVGAVRFPGGAHQENAGTAVVTDMIILRKRHPDEQPVTDETPSEAEPKGPGFTGITTDSLGRLYHWKDGIRVPGPKWDDVVDVPDPDGGDPIQVNRYFADNPQHILGRLDRSGTMYHAGNDNVSLVGPQELSEALGRSVVVHVTEDGKRRFVFEDDGSLIPAATIREVGMPLYEKKLDEFIESLPSGAFAPNRGSKAAFEPEVMPAPGDVKEGGYKIQDGKLYQRRGGALIEQKVNSKQLARIAGQLPILDATRGVINSQIGDAGEQSRDAARAKLNEVYDAYVAEHGYLHERENWRAMRDAGDDFYLLQSLEKWNAAEGTATKRDIFSKDTIRRETTFDHADSVADGFTISLHEKAGVDVDYIAELTGKSVEEVAMGLSDAGIAFEDPETGWTAADIYLSGNVRKKLMMAQAAAAADPRYQINVDALLKVQPEDKDYTEIGAKLGAVWIPPSDVAAFAAHLVGTRQDPSELFDVFHAPGVGWQARWTSKGARLYRDSAAATDTWGTSDNNVMTLLEAALTGKQIDVKGGMDERIEDDGTVTEFPAVAVDANGDTVNITNRKATEDAAAKIQEIKDEFKDWIWDDDDRTERLARYYNDNFNNIRDIDYDGSHLTFPGMNPAINLHPHIKDFVWQVINNGTALAGHEVGTGKSFAMIASAMELRRLGLAKKPCITCLKSNIDQITADVHELYPGAKVLSTADMFDAKKRKQTLAQIATGDYDLVVMTHDHINKLNMKPEVEAAYIREEIQELENAKRTAEAEGGKKNNRAVKALETAKKNLEKRLQQALDKKYSDDAISFEETGLDMLFVDECFPSNTVVATDSGPKTIGDIVENELQVQVLSCNRDDQILEWCPVTAWFKRPLRNHLVQVAHQYGSFVCTPNHNIWTEEDGYVKAGLLEERHTLRIMQQSPEWEAKEVLQQGMLRGGKEEACHKNVLALQTIVHKAIREQEKEDCLLFDSMCEQVSRETNYDTMSRVPEGLFSAAESGRWSSSVLQQEMFCHMAMETEGISGENTRGDQSRTVGRKATNGGSANARKQSDVRFGSPGSCKAIIARQEILSEGRKWVANGSASTTGISPGMDTGVCRQHKADSRAVQGHSKQLQGRHCTPNAENSNRDRWQNAQHKATERTGCEEDAGSQFSRVVSVTLHQRKGDERTIDGGDGDRFVYDIEVHGNHNYFADGVNVSNSHTFKTLPVFTKLQRVKGIPTGRSDRATNMLMRTRWLREQNGGRGVVFASGTPIDNTMAELYNNQRYLQPEELKERGINSFDDWANTFGEITTRHEFSVAGEYKPTTRFSTFTNVGNLMNITRQMLDVQRADDLKRPDGSLVIKRPKRHDVAVVSPKSQAIEDLMSSLAERAKAISKRRGPAQKGDDNMLVICTDGRKGALDMRLLDDTAPDDPNSKTNKCVDQVLKLHKARPDQAQIIFSDLGVNPQKNATTKDESVTDNNEQDSANLGSTGKFRLYDDIINKLVAGGIPRDQIADFSTLEGAKKQDAMARIRRGEIKVAIGSTKKLGTGTNVQTKIMAMHHLDVPWTPASVEQRDGRGWRHGNENWDHPEGIKVHRYITEGSLDQKFWSIISTKARFIKQVMTNADRNLNDVTEEDTEVLSPEHLMAIASGDSRVMKKIEIEDSVKKLRSAGSRHRRQQQKFKKAVSNHSKAQEERTKEISHYKQDAEKLAEVPDFKLALGDVSYDKRPEAAEALAARVARIDQRYESQHYMDETVGQYRGMKLKRKKSYRQAPYYTLVGSSGEEYTTGDSLQSIEYVARNLDKKRQDLEDEMKRADQDIETVKAKMGKPFKDESQLEKLESELREIEDDLTGKTAKKKAREAAASVETLAMGLRANPVAVHRLPPRTYAVVATALERLIGATRMSLDRQVRQSLRLKSRPPIGPETYRTLARVFERLIPPVQMALDNRRPITMAVKQTWTPFTTKSGKTGAYNAASGKRLYGSEAEKALAQKKQSAPEEQAGRRRGAKPDEAKSRRQAKPEGTKKFRNVAEAEKHVREKLPEFAKKQGKTPPELAKSMGFKDEEQMIKTSAASKAAGFKSLEEASAAKKVPIGDKLTEALDAGDKPKAKEPFVETPEQIAKQGELQVNELPRIDMPQLYDQAKIDFIAKLKKKGVRVQDQDIPASKLTGLQSEYKPDKVHGIAGAMSAGAKIGGGRALVTSDGYVIDGHHRWRASHQADKPVECTVIDMPAHQLIDQMHRYDKAERRTVNEVLVSKQTGFGNKMANYLHGKLDPVMQEAFKPSDYRLPVNKVQPFQSEDEVIEVAKQNEEDYHRILNMGLGVSKALGATAVDARVDGAFMDLLNKVDAGQLEGPFVLIAPLKTASEKGLKRAREKVEKNYDGDWGQLKDVVRGTIAVDKYDDIPAAVKALREHVQSRGWTLSMRPESRFANPTPAGYRDIQLFIESPDGMQCEVQVNTKAMWVAKEKYGHKMYEESRSLKGETDEERARIAELDKQMSDLYTKAWDASKGDQFD